MPQRSRPDDPEVIRLAAEAARVGMKYALIAQYAGIAESSLYKWLSLGREGSPEHVAFAEAIDSAESRGAAQLLARIHQAAQGGAWQAAAWILERRHGYVRTGVHEVRATVEAAPVDRDKLTAHLAAKLGLDDEAE